MTPTPLTSRSAVRDLVRIRRPLGTVPRSADVRTVRSTDGIRVTAMTLVPDEGDAVPCLYLTPDTPGPWPAVVAVHQHDGAFDLGKSEPAGFAGNPQMAYGAALARRGAAVLIPDLLGFEDRRRARPDVVGEQLDAFHLLGLGTTLQARHVEDVALCVSWLSEQGDGPIGMIGHSLGGQVTFFAAACDERVRAAVISCGLGTVESFHQAGVLHNSAWYLPDLLTAGDTTGVAAVVSGQSFWVSAGEADPLFPVAGVREAVAALPAGSTELRVFPGGHELPPALAAEAFDWLLSELDGADHADHADHPDHPDKAEPHPG